KAKRFEHLLSVTVDLDVVPALRDLTVRADEVRGPHDAHELAAVERLLLPHAVLLGDLMFGVGEQRKVQVELVGELLLALLIQDADAEDGGFTLSKPGQVVTKVA